MLNTQNIFLSLFFILISLYSTAQNIFVPGQIFLKGGDTLNSQIKYENSHTTPIFIVYKNNGKDDFFTPISIKGFQDSRDKFVSAIVDTERSPRITSKLNEKSSLRIVKDTIFLKVLVDGEKKLLSHITELGIENFYIENDGNYEHLPYKRFFKFISKKRVIVENRKFVFQLLSYFESQATMASQIEKVEYKKDDLIKLFSEYYKLSNTTPTSIKSVKSKLTGKLGLVAGLSNTNLRYRSNRDDFKEFVNADYSSFQNIIYGAKVEFFFPNRAKKWSLYTDLLISSTKIEGLYEEPTISTKLEFTLTQFQVNPIIRYNFSFKNLDLFLGAGPSSGFRMKEKNTKVQQITVVNLESTFSEELSFTDGFIKSLAFSLACNLNRFSIELRSSFSEDFSRYIYLSGSRQQSYLLLSYSLN